MTDEQDPNQRLPATRPQEAPAPVERFTAAPSVLQVDLPPERAAQIVRQSSNARWVGFLTVVIVVLFVALYWFYELGGPLGLTQSRLEAEADAQQVTQVERGYNIFQANCARCHGVSGEGGIGPVLNSQEKLYQHLNADYLNTMMVAGGRYACGNALSQMPVWSNTATPPGPLNYVQIEDLIAFIRAPNTQTYTIRDASLLEPKIDPITGKVRTFTGWVDPTYKPPPGATPYPACWSDSFATASPTPGPSGGTGSPAPSGGTGSPAPSDSGGTVTLNLTAPAGAAANGYTDKALTAPAGVTFNILFTNDDPGTPHNTAINDASGGQQFKGEIFNGVGTRIYQVPALPAGTYMYVCTVHPTMTGTLTVQ
jgi:mono/diheme cytochrome c family protein/plastocyanin